MVNKTATVLLFRAVERSDFYTQCEVPEKLLQRAEGQIVVNETLPYVCVPAINDSRIKRLGEIRQRS